MLKSDFCPDQGGGVVVVESLISNYNLKIKISPSKTITIFGGMITYLEYTFIITSHI
jgi:hypothetical protein